jgi:hypothetical protein
VNPPLNKQDDAAHNPQWPKKQVLKPADAASEQSFADTARFELRG